MSWIEWTDSNFRGLDLHRLSVDQAYFNISNGMNQPLFLYTLSEECIKCPFRKIKEISKHKDTILKLDTARSLEMRLYTKDYGDYVFPNITSNGLYWSAQPEMGEFGVYDLVIMETKANRLMTAKDPVSTNSSLAVALFIVILFYWICKGINKLYLNRTTATLTEPDNENQSSDDNELDTPQTKKRLKSLDIFRGIAIVLMIFVNSGGGHYWWIEHAVWNGLHVADVVFPWFLFIMGVCIPLSLKSQVNRQVPMKEIARKIIRRSITLFMIGLFLNTIYGTSFQSIRLFGVLQRFGIAYLVVSLLHITFMTNSLAAETRIEQIFYDIRIIWKQWIVVLIIICAHLVVTFGFPVPGCESGYLGPGGIHDYLQHQNCTGGATGLIDRTLLGVNHMYQRAKIRSVYDALVFDPEGFFGCLLTIVQVFLGVQCGATLLVYPTAKDRIRRWIIWGLGLGILTALLTLFSVNDGFIPINKNMWSMSFVAVTSSLAFLLLSLIYYLVDVKNIGDDVWTIFLYPGMNAIFLYVGHSIFHKMLPFHWSIEPMNTHFILLLENLYATIIWILIAHKLYQKKIFYSI